MKHDLLWRARDSLKGTRRPRSVLLRRSVSDSYYALFHALCQMGADSLIGAKHRNTESWRRIYRGYDHTNMKIELKRNDVRSIDISFTRLSLAFIQLQEARHIADYDPFTPYRRRADVEPYVLAAEVAIKEVENLPADLARQLSSILLVKKRS